MARPGKMQAEKCLKLTVALEESKDHSPDGYEADVGK